MKSFWSHCTSCPNNFTICHCCCFCTQLKQLTLQQFKAKLFHYNFNIQMAFKRGEESEEICAKASRLAIVTMATQEVKTEGKLCWLVWKRCLRMCVCVNVNICKCVWESLLHFPSLKCLPCLANCFGNLFNWPGQIELGMKTFLSLADSHQS